MGMLLTMDLVGMDMVVMEDMVVTVDMAGMEDMVGMAMIQKVNLQKPTSFTSEQPTRITNCSFIERYSTVTPFAS